MTVTNLQEEIDRKEVVIRTLKDTLVRKELRIACLINETSALKEKVLERESEIAQLSSAADALIHDQNRNQSLVEEIEYLANGLEYYSDPDNYSHHEKANGIPVMMDGGRRARQRLEKVDTLRSLSLLKTLTDKVAAQREVIAKQQKELEELKRGE